MRELLFFLLTLTVHSQLLKTQWFLESNQTTIYEQAGLRLREGHCSWAIVDQYQNIELDLYQDDDYQRKMVIKIFLNYSINKAYPTYDGLAHMEYQYFEQGIKHEKIKNFDLMPNIYLFNNTLEVSYQNSTLLVDIQKQALNLSIVVLALIHLIVKLVLLFLTIEYFRANNTLISMAFVYILIGWELQAHIHVIKIFEANKDPELFSLGLIIGMTGWLSTLFCLVVLPRPHYSCQQLEGLAYYAYICSQGFLFSQAHNILLYAIAPILQVRFNLFRNIKNSICRSAYFLYFFNIFLLYYIKGCPACLLRYPVDISVCIKATIIAILLRVILYKQKRMGPMLCARELIQGKDYSYMEEVNLSEGEEMLEEVCSICLQPLFTEALIEEISERQGKRVGKIMKTPCNHRYHATCLRQWLKEKSTCPLDNMQIPPCFD